MSIDKPDTPNPPSAGPDAEPKPNGSASRASELVSRGPNGRMMPRGRPENIRKGSPAIHGGRSKLTLEPLVPQRVEELKAFLEEHGSRWMTRADEPLIINVARNMVIIDQMWSYMLVRGSIDTHGRPRGVMRQWYAAQNSLTRQLSALGCSPLARAELGANLAASKLDSAQAMRYGRPRSERAPVPVVHDVETSETPE